MGWALAVHVLALILLARVLPVVAEPQVEHQLDVRIIELPPVEVQPALMSKVQPVKVQPVKVQPVKVQPVKVQPVKVQPVKVHTPEVSHRAQTIANSAPIPVPARQIIANPAPVAVPVLTTAQTHVPGPSASVSTQQDIKAAPTAVAPVPVAEEITTAARYDAAYLQNPRADYPPQSQRDGEEGTVTLRVRVSAEGLPLDVSIKQSSNFPRLDRAARDVVLTWRFVPARRGQQAVESVVNVPYSFKMDP